MRFWLIPKEIVNRPRTEPDAILLATAFDYLFFRYFIQSFIHFSFPEILEKTQKLFLFLSASCSARFGRQQFI